MVSIQLPEWLVVAFLVLLVGLGRHRIPALLESLEDGIHLFRERVLGDPPRMRVVVRPVMEDRCYRCTEAAGVRCSACKRLTRSGSVVLLSGLILLTAVAVWWHVAMPVL